MESGRVSFLFAPRGSVTLALRCRGVVTAWAVSPCHSSCFVLQFGVPRSDSNLVTQQ